jgi:hypothetical protein
MHAKPVLGVIRIGKQNHYKGEIRSLVRYYFDRIAGDPTVDLLIPDGVLCDKAEITARARPVVSVRKGVVARRDWC